MAVLGRSMKGIENNKEDKMKKLSLFIVVMSFFGMSAVSMAQTVEDLTGRSEASCAVQANESGETAVLEAVAGEMGVPEIKKELETVTEPKEE